MEIFILTLQTRKAIQKYKIQKTCNQSRQSNNKYMQPKSSKTKLYKHYVNQKALTEIIQVLIKDYLHQSLLAVKQ